MSDADPLIRQQVAEIRAVIARLEKKVSEEGDVVQGRFGPRSHPLLGEISKLRNTVSTLLRTIRMAELKVKDPEPESPFEDLRRQFELQS